MAESEGCANQALEYNGRVVGLQFHLESSAASIQNLIQNCKDEIGAGRYIQEPEEILGQQENLLSINGLMELLLNHLEKKLGCGF